MVLMAQTPHLPPLLPQALFAVPGTQVFTEQQPLLQGCPFWQHGWPSAPHGACVVLVEVVGSAVVVGADVVVEVVGGAVVGTGVVPPVATHSPSTQI